MYENQNGKVKNLYTIGYEGRDQANFIECLCKNGIEVIIDVREYAISRKKGFSKNKLSTMARQNGIEYIHMAELGSPKKSRDMLRATGNFDTFYSDYKNHLENHRDILNKILSLIEQKKCCMLCFEQDPEKCHRTIIANEMKENNSNIEVIHI